MFEYDSKYNVIIGHNNSTAGGSSVSLEAPTFIVPPVNFKENPLNSRLLTSWGPCPYQKTDHISEIQPKNELFEDSVSIFMGFLSIQTPILK